MTQEERWHEKDNEVKDFIETDHRYSSKHRIEEHDMLNWIKANRKLLNASGMKPERIAKFKELFALVAENKRKNQYE